MRQRLRVPIRPVPHRRSQLFAAGSSSARRADHRDLPRSRYVPIGADAGGRAAIRDLPDGDAADSRRTSAGRLGDLRYGGGPRRAARVLAWFRPSVSASCRLASATAFRPTPTQRADGAAARLVAAAPRSGRDPSRRQHHPAQARRRAARDLRRAGSVRARPASGAGRRTVQRRPAADDSAISA